MSYIDFFVCISVLMSLLLNFFLLYYQGTDIHSSLFIYTSRIQLINYLYIIIMKINITRYEIFIKL